MKKTKIRWLRTPQKHDYPAAQSYLTLLFPPRVAQAMVGKLERAGIVEFAAKDIFRASRLALLGSGNSHVDRYRTIIIHKQPISPILLCRDAEHGKVIIADGYHRLCAVYTLDEDAMIPCQII